MLPLMEMLTQANNGQAVEEMARRFGLSQQKTMEAIEALIPAFSTGLKRNASDPMGVAGFLQALASGQHAKYFEDMGRAFDPSGMAEGNGILGHLFGSKEISRAVAAQAAQATGIGQEIMKQMLPVLASAIMGGLFKQSTGQLSAAQAGGFGGGNIIGQVIEQMMKQGMGQQPAPQPQPRRPEPQAAPDPFDNPFGKILKDMFGGGMAPPEARQPQPRQREERAAPEARQPSPWGDNPLGQIFEDMMRGNFGQGTPRAPHHPQPDPRDYEPAPQPRQRQADRMPSGRARNPYDDLFGEMFETGRKTQDSYQRGIESIFEQFTRGMDRHR